MAQTSMRQIGTRHMGCRVDCMEWSNKMDLIAFGNDKGEVVIQRLNWQKIVTFPPPGEDAKVRSLSWQQDETTLAVGYSTGQVALLDAERETQISAMVFEGEDIRKVYFSKAVKAKDYRNIYRKNVERTYEFFLPELPTLNGIGTTAKPSIEDHKSFTKGSPSFLVIVLSNGKVHLLLLGALKVGYIDLTLHVMHPMDFKVYDVHLSGRFNGLYALVRDGNHLKCLHFQNKLLQESLLPMLHLSSHCGHILETKSYINETIQCMLEAWETVVIEMDNKLTKYAIAQPEGALSADLLELLVFGYATNEIEEFLTEDLTEKGLKKLANSVDLSYSTIQNLVAKPLQGAAINLFYFLNTIKGLANISHFYEPLISRESAERALRLAGAFLVKILEMQQVVDQCVCDMKLFFSWLCMVILRLHQQDITDDMTPITAEDAIYLAEYLNSFEDNIVENDTTMRRKFNLEKVGQYMEDRPLHQLAKADVYHLFNKLLEENECLANCPLLFPHDKHNSLVQQCNHLMKAIDELFQRPNDNVSANFFLHATITCCDLPAFESAAGSIDFVRSSYHIKEETQSDLFVTTIGWHEVLLLEFRANMLMSTRISLQAGPFTAPLSCPLENLVFIDLQFYNEHTIALLLQSGRQKIQSHYVQFGLDMAGSKHTQHALPGNVDLLVVASAAPDSIHDMVERGTFKLLDGGCTNIAVSGSRKVATILADERRKMTIYEMEIEDDEDETEMSQNSLLEISKDSLASVHDPV